MPDSGTSEEIIELVDEHDQVIGTVTAREANQDPTKYHREVGVLIVDSRGQILLQQRALTKQLEPGKWTMAAAGHIPVGMTPEQAAHMELEEELGFDTELAFIEKRFDQIPTQSRFFYFFIGQVDDPEITLETEEVADAGFYDESESLKLLDWDPDGLNQELTKRFFAGEFAHLLP